MTHRLHDHPRCRPEDLGAPIPDSPHAVSVCLPSWADVIGYEEKDPRVLGKMRTGYPRFFLHPLVNAVRENLRAGHGLAGEDALPFPGRQPAQQCADFVGAPARVAACGGLWAAFFPSGSLSRACAYWQHAGCILSSRACEDWLQHGRLAEADPRLEGRMKAALAAWSGSSPDLTTLHPSGMAAIFAAFLVVTSRRPGRRTVMFGFPYTDTLKILEKFGVGVEFFARGDAADLERLGSLLAQEEIAGVFCEFPGNPLLNTPDLPALGRLARNHGVPVVVDDTIGTFFNVDVLPHADLVATSLTKSFSGEGDVMAGALSVSPDGLMAGAPLPPQTAPLYVRDLQVLEANSHDFAQRMAASNAQALRLAEFLQEHPAVEKVHYPGLPPAPAYEALRKPGGGYGALLSFLPRYAATQAPRIFERLSISRGISLGTSYSLVCPYVQLAHYRELDWARSCGIDPFLLRVAVGTEPWEDLRARFEVALA